VCGVYLYGLEIDPGDGGAEVMKKDEHFIAPRLSREASKKTKQEEIPRTGHYVGLGS
jgi:hypothetical protein